MKKFLWRTWSVTLYVLGVICLPAFPFGTIAGLWLFICGKTAWEWADRPAPDDNLYVPNEWVYDYVYDEYGNAIPVRRR